MALDITALEIVIDETTGLTDDDINPAAPPHDSNTTLAYLLGLGTALETAYKADFVQATASAGETITSIVLTQDALGTPFSETDGLLTDIKTVDGNFVWLFQDPNNADVVIGVIGTDDPTAEPDPATAPLAFSFGLDPTSNTDADLYLVQYVALLNPDPTLPDQDLINLQDKVFASIEGTSLVSFTGESAHPGSNEFNLLSSPDDASQQLLVTGLVRSSQLDPNSALVNSECNVSQQGFGVDNQSIQPDTDGQNQPLGREVLQIDFVTGGTDGAGDGEDIAYGSHLENVTQAGFEIGQLTPSTSTLRADISISAFNVQGNEQGAEFFDGSPTTPVDITSLTLTGASALATITADGTYSTPSGNVTVTGLSGTGNKVIITGLDNVTTVDITTSSPMDRLHVESVDSNEGIDITEVHFSAQTTSAYTEEVGSFINFDDDGPSITPSGDETPTVVVDETLLNTTDSANFSGLFTPDYGTDGAAATDSLTYALGVLGGGTDVDSGLVDTVSGEAVVLNLDAGGVVIGTTALGGIEVFRISVDATGEVTLDQSRAVVHDDPTDPDENTSPATLAANLVTLTATATDGDGDSAPTTVDIGDAFNFEDDGPSITPSGDETPTVVVDETLLNTTDSVNFSGLFTPDYGTDGPAATDSLTYALGVLGGGSNVATGLFDTLSGLEVLLNVDGDDIVGSAGGDEVFRISVDADGNVTLDQSRALIHGDPTDPDENDTPLTMAANLVTLTATATDGDGDSAPTTVDIGDAFNFEDDGPTITVPFDGDASGGGSDGTPETLDNTAGAQASGAFGYNIGADSRPASFYDATHSDFVDTDDVLAGIQIALTGSITGGGGGNILTSDVTLFSESATSATFDFTFTYDKDPAAGEQTGTAGGTLFFDKVLDTYTITLNDPLEGFSFDVLHTNELLAKAPTGNTGHPLIVAEQLTPDGDPDPFFVQFTANSTTNSIKFGFNSTGEGAVAGDTTFNNDGATHDMITNLHEDWVSATQATNGVAGDTIQKGEALTLRFFEENILGDVNPKAPGGGTEQVDPTASASGIVIKFDGIGNSEDLVLILDLKDANGNEITRAVNVQNSDLIKGNVNVPFPYSTEFTLDNNDALLILEQNDYTDGTETYQIQGVQIMQSANGLTGSAINLNGAIGAGGDSNATSGLSAWDPTDNDVLKIVDIGFVQQTSGTVDASLDFAFEVADADGDMTATQHILVDVA